MGPRFDRTARCAVLGAIDAAAARRDPRAGTEHLLLGLLAVDAPSKWVLRDLGLSVPLVSDALDDVDRAALAAVGVDADRPELRSAAGADAAGPCRRRRSRPRLNRGARDALGRAVVVARRFGARRVAAEHLLVAAADGGPGDPAMVVLGRLGVDAADLRRRAAGQLYRPCSRRWLPWPIRRRQWR